MLGVIIYSYIYVMEYTVYALSTKNNPEDIFYIGRTRLKLKRRLASHMVDLNRDVPISIKISGLLKTGLDVIITPIETELDRNDAPEIEKYYIEQLVLSGIDLMNVVMNPNRKKGPTN